MSPDAIQRAAALIGAARLAGRGLASLPADCAPADQDEGYAVQDALRGWMEAAGQGPQAGYKIGATTPVMQRMLGVPGPIYGGIHAAAVQRDPGRFDRAAFHAPGIECEFAVVMAADAPPGDGPYDRAGIAGRIETCHAAIEVVDNRYGDWARAGVPLTTADDFFHAACVLGPPVPSWRDLDLAALAGRIEIDGEARGTGHGRDVMGHPMEAVAWLANALAARGAMLRAGDIVLTGSLVAVQWLDKAPCEAAIEIERLGRVEARFA